MIKRKSLSRLARVRIFDNSLGVCCLCCRVIRSGEKWIVEHVKPLWLGGADDETNMAPAHFQCGVEKTCGEAPVKAKTDRQRAAHLGIRKRQARPMPGTKASGWSKKFSGEVVRR